MWLPPCEEPVLTEDDMEDWITKGEVRERGEGERGMLYNYCSEVLKFDNLLNQLRVKQLKNKIVDIPDL